MRKSTMWFSNRSNINQSVQAQKRLEGVEAEILDLESRGIVLPHLCFRICKLLGFSLCGSYLEIYDI